MSNDISSDNPLLRTLDSGLDHVVHKWNHYLPLYHKHFKKYRKIASPENKIKILEIGVFYGGSIDMWNEYFGKDNCEIYAVDINPSCVGLQKGNVKIYIGDQADKLFLSTLTQILPKFDIIIDDGGHRMDQQINTFEILFPHLSLGGTYLCEDTHTSYWPDYGGIRPSGLFHNGVKTSGSFHGHEGRISSQLTFIEYTKKLVDCLNANHYMDSSNNHFEHFIKYCLGIYYYDSMVFFEKSPTEIPKPSHKIWPAKGLGPSSTT